MRVFQFSANLIVPFFAAGLIGPALFKLNFYESFGAVIFFTLIGVLPVAGMACFGPASGLRTMVFSRFSWGYCGASILSVVNLVSAAGWSAPGSIVAGQILRVVFTDKFPIVVGIVIIGIASMVVSFVGYKWIHIFVRYSWVPVFIAFVILAVVGGKHVTMADLVTSSKHGSLCRIVRVPLL